MLSTFEFKHSTHQQESEEVDSDFDAINGVLQNINRTFFGNPRKIARSSIAKDMGKPILTHSRIRPFDEEDSDCLLLDIESVKYSV